MADLASLGGKVGVNAHLKAECPLSHGVASVTDWLSGSSSGTHRKSVKTMRPWNQTYNSWATITELQLLIY
jgi:hypothetical protein